MKVENGKIVRATEFELFQKWLREEWFEVYSFDAFLCLCAENGTTIADDDR